VASIPRNKHIHRFTCAGDLIHIKSGVLHEVFKMGDTEL
jgi:hypothetical protein